MNNQLSDVLMSLIEEDKISRKTICTAAKISENTLDKYLLGDPDSLNPDDIRYLDELTMLVSHGLSLVSEDDRVKAILENLIYDYGFTCEQLSRLLGIDLQILKDVLNSEKVSIEDKYLLAVKEAYLFYALKRGN